MDFKKKTVTLIDETSVAVTWESSKLYHMFVSKFLAYAVSEVVDIATLVTTQKIKESFQTRFCCIL